MTQSIPRNKKRRIYYIEKEFQLKFIAKFCMLVAFGSVLTVGLVYWLAQRSTTVAFADGHVAVRTTADYLLPVMIETALIQLGVVALATVVMVLLISHKIAGPLFRLKVMLKGLAHGDTVAVMQLRDGDQLKTVADAYNEAVAQLNVRIKTLKGQMSHVQANLKELSPKSLTEAERARLEEIKQEFDNSTRTLGSFKT